MVDPSLRLVKTTVLSGVLALLMLLALDFTAPALRVFHQAHHVIVDISVWVVAAGLTLFLVWFRPPKPNP
jgi:hypothetical protein